MGWTPSYAALRRLGGKVLGVARSHRDLLGAFEALDAGTQRAVARWLARRAFEIAELDQLEWVRPALEALDRGAPLPLPFTAPAEVFPLVGPGMPGTENTIVAYTVVGVGAAAADQPGPARRIHRPSFAVPAIFSATHPDPLRALVDTFSHAAATFDEHREDLVRELRQRYLDRGH